MTNDEIDKRIDEHINKEKHNTKEELEEARKRVRKAWDKSNLSDEAKSMYLIFIEGDRELSDYAYRFPKDQKPIRLTRYEPRKRR